MIDMDVVHIFALKDNQIFKLNRKVEEMQKVIDTAVMFLQGNELFIKAEQIKAMSQSLKGESQ